ncbi:diguanylate cyclase (GGDEF) domain-containing protein [Pseudobutyrivibrio sp. YE44]|uniref:diguanylate cyclase domain-containing protein n=1 Tax=Pseudobutyrivibrio sp. YE44 TaxID=1520802 RepID=UPI0008882260|nr:diguanylate cyclase [Pseudobutyrivibrio sp. YE44]SDB37724.1 diguanylate cyclase (GGDEF) domain-containing protein [Pseudobutyrivibrio sp. YE44]
MRSIRTKLTVTMLCVIFTVILIITLLSAIFIRITASRKSDQLLLMLCENGQYSLNYYFDSVQNSVNDITDFVENDLQGLDDEQLEEHMEDVREYFDFVISHTNGVLTYYYRIDPTISSNVKGFWYTNLDGKGFTEHEVTDISLYDVNDTSKLVWFTVPKFEGKSIWLPPYVTDNLDVKVISYDAPIYYKEQFIGVVGIEIDYSAMAEEVDSIKFYDNGYAFLSDANGTLFYHPYIDVANLPSEEEKQMPYNNKADTTSAQYTYDGVLKEAVWLPLSNGMYLNITVPLSETQGEWRGLIINILICAVIALFAAGIFLVFSLGLITKPLIQLTEAAAQVDKGNFDVDLSYDKDDEIGRLTKSFKNLTGNMKAHISALNEQAFKDPLTHVKNKGAFLLAIEELQEQINNGSINPNFALGEFDCDGLKRINDEYGHDKGDIYLKKACRTISDVFKRSPVYRVGGDEFFIILKNEDFHNLEFLLKRLDVVIEGINASADNPWEQVWLSKGFAIYDPAEDDIVQKMMQRADMLMYEDKHERKMGRQD